MKLISNPLQKEKKRNIPRDFKKTERHVYTQRHRSESLKSKSNIHGSGID